MARQACRGARGCVQSGRAAHCDQSIAREGDGCQLGSACAEGGGALLRCVKGEQILAQTCRGSRGCQVAGERVSCDSTLAKTGDPCLDEGTGACRDDRAAVLICRGARYAELRPCPGEAPCGGDQHEFSCRVEKRQ